jgi:hypothetical protein
MQYDCPAFPYHNRFTLDMRGSFGCLNKRRSLGTPKPR